MWQRVWWRVQGPQERQQLEFVAAPKKAHGSPVMLRFACGAIGGERARLLEGTPQLSAHLHCLPALAALDQRKSLERPH